MAHLGALDFIAAKSNAVFLGPPGTGKSHLSIALGAALAPGIEWGFGYRGRVGGPPGAPPTTAADCKTSCAALGWFPLWVIIDEAGSSPFQGEAANLFFQLVSSRYERASVVIVSSNKAFSRWGEVFGDDTVAAAMIDRLVHHAEIINLKGQYRLKGRDLGRVPDPDRTTNA